MARSPKRRIPATRDELGLGGFRQPAEEQGLPLDELSAALVRLMDKGDDPYQPLPASGSTGEASSLLEELDIPTPAETDVCPVTPKSILEAMLFVGSPHNEPLTSSQVAGMMRGVRPQEIEAYVTELNEAYREQGCPYQIVSEGAGYRMVLRDEFASLRDKFYHRIKEARLSQSAVDVLAIVAYRQPMTREQVDALRGKPSGGVLSQLVRRQLLRIERSSEAARQPHYRTTERFLKLFGLQNLAELPQSQDDDRAP
jgi:segregation and condensation protein B